MQQILTPLYNGSKYLLVDFWHEVEDKRVSDYWLAKNGMLNAVLIVGSYLLFSNYLGPKLMKNREPFSLKPVLVAYNLSMALANVYFFVLSIVVLKFGVAIFEFDAPDSNDRSAWAMYTIESGYIYLVSKYLDFFDSLFFVLRKKFTHLNFLHLYHHSSVAGLGTMVFILYPTATPLGIFTLLNSLIHVVMYTYYGLSALGSWIQPYLWWKKYITQIQIVQFLIYIVYLVAFAVLQKGYSPHLILLGWTQAPLFLYLFVRFYINTYNKEQNIKNAKPQHLEKNSCNNNNNEFQQNGGSTKEINNNVKNCVADGAGGATAVCKQRTNSLEKKSL